MAQAAAALPSSVSLSADGRILIGVSDSAQYLELSRANRHGLIAGATGTGKTVTLQTLAEGFSKNGVPVFMADVKGDLSGISMAGSDAKMTARAASMNISPFAFEALPVTFWDVFGKSGHPVRVTVSELGPVLLSQLLELSDAQEGVLTIAFKLADDEALLLLDLKDLQALLTHVNENAKDLSAKYGNISPATVASIQRKLLQLEQDGANVLFGEPALDIHDMLRTDSDGNGVINLLAAEVLINRPKLYATFLLWLLSELFEQLPEVGDIARPKLVFFFDEAHLLFADAEKALLQKVEQVVRLIRSKGVGVYFITQQPQDIPDNVLAQLSNRVQHALRGFTPQDQKALKAAAASFRANPKFKTEETIQALAVGEALVSVLEADGSPSIVERTKIRPPFTRIGAISAEERAGVMKHDAIGDTYDVTVDRESAYEKLNAKHAQAAAVAAQQAPAAPRGRQPDTLTEQLAKAAIRAATSSAGRQIGNQIVRGILGSILR